MGVNSYSDVPGKGASQEKLKPHLAFSLARISSSRSLSHCWVVAGSARPNKQRRADLFVLADADEELDDDILKATKVHWISAYYSHDVWRSR